MAHNLLVFFRFYFVNLKSLQEYKLNWFASLLKTPFVLTLQYFLWQTLYSFSGGSINGYSFPQILIYFSGLAFISLSLGQSVADKIQSDIQKGNLAVNLARPVSYLGVKYAEFCAYWSISAAVAFGLMLAAVLVLGLKISLVSTVLLAASLFLSSVIFFLFEVIMGVCSIWLYRILGLKLLITTIFDLFGGKLFPVDFLPSSIHWMSYLSPWRSVYYEPLKFLQGSESFSGLFLQLLTVGILMVVALGVWHVGHRKYDGGL